MSMRLTISPKNITTPFRTPTKIGSFPAYSSDKATVDNAILKADKAEARALEVLNGIY